MTPQPRRKPYVKNRTTALWLGAAMLTGGALLVWDAYEHRGRPRPLWLRFLPAG